MVEKSSPRGPREILKRQREIYAELLGMSTHQVDLVKQTKTDELLSLLAEKQTVLTELAELQEKLSPGHPDWDKAISALSEHERADLRQIAAEIASLLERILKLDEEGREALEKLRDSILSQLKQISSGRKLAKTYKPKRGDAGVRFIDETS